MILAKAKELFPGVSLIKPGARTESADMADALLIAEYLLRHGLPKA